MSKQATVTTLDGQKHRGVLPVTAQMSSDVATFTVTLPGPHADEWTTEALRQDIMEAYGLTEQEVKVEKA